MTKTEMFEDVVGQPEAKSKLAFYLNSYFHTHIMPNVGLCAAKGNGKTMIAKGIGKNLIEFDDKGKPVMKADGVTPKKKPFYEFNASNIKNDGKLAQILQDHCQDKAATIFIDEAHQLKEDVTTSLLTILAPNSDNRNQWTCADFTYDIDFRKHTFIFATSESHSIFAPLMDRLKRIDLEPYTISDLAKIVQKSAPEVIYKDDVMPDIASVVRGNARQAVAMAADVRAYLCGGITFGKKHWNELKKVLSIKPLGLSALEIQLLHCMAERPDGSSLTNLAARTGLSQDAIRKDGEMYLQLCGLMQITAGKGRQLTAKGQRYLKDLAK